jgi:hypothetical protein
MSNVTRAVLLLALAACGEPASNDIKGGGEPTAPPVDDVIPVTDANGEVVPEMPRGLPTIAPQDLTVRIDAAVLRCEGNMAGAVDVDTTGHADRIEVDLIGADVVTVVANLGATTSAEAVWRSFHGATTCEAVTGATAVLRAYRGDALVDCAVTGPETAVFLAGEHDAWLSDEGRAGAAGCHSLSGR